MKYLMKGIIRLIVYKTPRPLVPAYILPFESSVQQLIN